jgi:hypothetical protein
MLSNEQKYCPMVSIVPLFCGYTRRSMCRPYHPHIGERLSLSQRPAAWPPTLMQYPPPSHGRGYIEICHIQFQILSNWSSKSDRWIHLEDSSILPTTNELEADKLQWRTTYPGKMTMFLEGCWSHIRRLLALCVQKRRTR